jgi:hypothetical protein
MYKVASASRQSALHRGRLADWQNGVEHLTPAQELEQLKSSHHILEDRIKNTTDEFERRKLGREKLALQDRSKELKAQLGFAPNVRNHQEAQTFEKYLVDATKAVVSKVQWGMISNMARRAEQQARGAAQ